MKLTLKRSGKIKSFEAILTIDWFSPNRPDLVELLKFIKENGGIITPNNLKSVMGEVPDFVLNGVIKHLKNTGFIHPHGLISSKGNLVVETGKVPIEEKGQFKIYYIEDSLLGNYLLHFERSTKINNDKLVKLNAKQYLDKTYTSIVNSFDFKIKDLSDSNKNVVIEEESGEYKLEWDIDTLRENPSRMFLSGELKEPGRKNNKKFLNKEVFAGGNIDPDTLISLIIQRFKKTEREWDEGRKLLLVPFDSVKKHEFETLTTSLLVPEWGNEGVLAGFGKSKINRIPIGPLNFIEAKKWIVEMAKTYLKDGYKHKTELKLFLEELKDNTAFSNYEDVIDNITLEDILSKTKLDEDYQSYWNLQAPIDLFLELDDKFIIRNKRLDLAAGTKLSMTELVHEIVNNEVPDTLVFSSKYIQNPQQIKKFELFVKAFKAKGVQNILLVTKHEVNFQDKDIKIETYDNVYSGTIPPHDRYFAFRVNGEWHRYKMTAELDQCRFESQYVVNEHTSGVWRDISFIEIKPEIFPQKLNEQLSILEEVYYL